MRPRPTSASGGARALVRRLVAHPGRRPGGPRHRAGHHPGPAGLPGHHRRTAGGPRRGGGHHRRAARRGGGGGAVRRGDRGLPAAATGLRGLRRSRPGSPPCWPATSGRSCTRSSISSRAPRPASCPATVRCSGRARHDRCRRAGPSAEHRHARRRPPAPRRAAAAGWASHRPSATGWKLPSVTGGSGTRRCSPATAQPGTQRLAERLFGRPQQQEVPRLLGSRSAAQPVGLGRVEPALGQPADLRPSRSPPVDADRAGQARGHRERAGAVAEADPGPRAGRGPDGRLAARLPADHDLRRVDAPAARRRPRPAAGSPRPRDRCGPSTTQACTRARRALSLPVHGKKVPNAE